MLFDILNMLGYTKTNLNPFKNHSNLTYSFLFFSFYFYQLEPLVHQVGGHSSIYVLEDETVCKPLIGRESQFYHSLPPEIKLYAPEFRGTLEVVLQEAGEGGLSLAALPNKQVTSLWSGHGALR